jgi:hypothetical protein
MDDVSLLRQLTPDLTSRAMALVPSAPAWRLPGGGFSLPLPRIGQTPPAGARILFYLKNQPDSAADGRLEIVDGSGAVVRTWKTQPGKADASGIKADSLVLRQGMNQVRWNLRHAGPAGLPGIVSFGGGPGGRLVVPGDYQARLTVGTETATAPVKVVTDPRLDHPAAAYAAQDEVTRALQGMITDLYASVRSIRSARDQVNDLIKRTEDRADAAAIKTAGEPLVKRLTEVDEALVSKATNGQDIINYPTRFDSQVTGLMGAIDGTEPPLTGGQKQRFADLQAEWARHRAAIDQVLGGELEAFNRLVREKNVPAVSLPPR